jgi:hypothetical protein
MGRTGASTGTKSSAPKAGQAAIIKHAANTSLFANDIVLAPAKSWVKRTPTYAANSNFLKNSNFQADVLFLAEYYVRQLLTTYTVSTLRSDVRAPDRLAALWANVIHEKVNGYGEVLSRLGTEDTRRRTLLLL